MRSNYLRRRARNSRSRAAATNMLRDLFYRTDRSSMLKQIEVLTTFENLGIADVKQHLKDLELRLAEKEPKHI